MDNVSFADKFNGFYEELINFYHKIDHACEIGDTVTALFAAVEITHELEEFFSGTGVSSKQLPDIVGAYDPETLEQFLATVHEHQRKWCNHFSLLIDLGITAGKPFSRFSSSTILLNSLMISAALGEL